MRLAWLSCAGPLVIVACSSSTPSSGSSGSSGGSSSSSSSGSSGSSGGSSSGGGCSCSITYNDVPGAVACGKSSCVNGENFSCASDGSGASDEGACPAQTDAGGSSSGSSGSSCTKLGGSSCEMDSDCCSGLSCFGQGCYVTTGGACSGDDQCQPDDPPFAGQSCGAAHTCCEKTNYPCTEQGPDSACCSGTCSAPNGSGISFCL